MDGSTSTAQAHEQQAHARTGAGTSGMELETPLIFDQGVKGRHGASLPPRSGFPEVDAAARFGKAARQSQPLLPEVSEPEAFRHFVRLSRQNFAIDLGMYPLGSCTMKYNPKVNEWAARLPGFARLHPFAPDSRVQGALELIWRLESALAEICGMDRVSLHPAAGAHGELAGLMMIRAYHAAQGRSPKKVLIPDTAHGTNPASCALNGLEAVPFPVDESGIVFPEKLAEFVDDDVAAVMITNPNTVGLFETHIKEIADMVHAKGGLVYGDGANLNALMGRGRPGDFGIDVMQLNLHKTFTTPHGGGGPGCGPVAYKALLDPHAPVPVVEKSDSGHFSLDYDSRPGTIGRMRSFHMNFGMVVRAYTYIRELGAEGLTQASEFAVLNANYLRARLADAWHIAYDRICMHEVVMNDKKLRETGVSTMDIAKRLMDFGFHPPTVYFPLVVKNALLVEPTETETRQSLDEFVGAMNQIATEARESPDTVKHAPHHTRLKRLDEARAARKPVLRWRPAE